MNISNAACDCDCREVVLRGEVLTRRLRRLRLFVALSDYKEDAVRLDCIWLLYRTLTEHVRFK